MEPSKTMHQTRWEWYHNTFTLSLYILFCQLYTYMLMHC